VTALSLLGGTIAIWVLTVARLVHARSPERQQLAWLVCLVIPFFLLGFATRFQGFAVALPVAVAVGVLRYRLLGIEVVLRRGLVYAVLTLTVIGVFLVVTAIAGSRLDHGPLPGVVAAPLVAVGLTPLRERVQRGVDRLVYGDRRDPMRAITRVGDSVAASGEPQDLLPAVLMTVRNAVQAPGAAVLSPEGRIVAAHGTAREGADLPLRVSGQQVGTLRMAARSPREQYTDADLRLLAALTPQVAVVVRPLDLAEALEAERGRVVAATRAERDRLRRDLHDGLGPSLSGISLGLQALGTAWTVGDEPTASDLLGRVRAEAHTAVGEVGRILDGLRPAALDDAGLVAAMRRHADTVAPGVSVELDVVTALPLPPEVETAAYRIAQEALTNVVRHAHAGRARVALATEDGALRIEVADDGHGFMTGQSPQSPGVGLASMRHRADTLGGTLDVRTGAAAPRSSRPCPWGPCRWERHHDAAGARGDRRRPPHVPVRTAGRARRLHRSGSRR